MNYAGLSKDMQVFGISGKDAIKSFITADLFALDSEQLKVTGVGHLGDTFVENVIFNVIRDVSKR